MNILPAKSAVSSQDFSHGFRRSPSDSSRLVVQGPHEAPHDDPGGFQIAVGKAADNLPRGSDSPPFDLLVAALNKRQKRVDDLPKGKTFYLGKGLVQIPLVQEMKEFFLDTAPAVLQLKGPRARDRNGERDLLG